MIYYYFILMSMKQIDIEKFLDLSNYATDDRVSRRKDSDVNSQEFFTPYSIVKRMCDKIPDSDWSNPEKTFLEPSFGNGQFVLYIIYKRLNSGISWKDTLSTLYGIELMADNVQETKERIFKLLDEMKVDYSRREAQEIMDHNLVYSDFFKWDFDNWKPIEEEKEPESIALF